MSFISRFSRLTTEQRRLWKIATGVIVAGTVFKFTYFKFSRDLIIQDMHDTHQDATKNLKEARAFAKWSHEDREKRLPPLTPEQRKQLKNYLELMAEQNPQVYPRSK